MFQVSKVVLKSEMEYSSHKKRKVHAQEKHHKKTRFMWPSELHDEFIAAIFDLGLAHITIEHIMEHAEAKGHPANLDLIAVYMRLMRGFRNQRRDANCCKMVAKIPASKLISSEGGSRRPSISSISSSSPRSQTGLFNESIDQPILSAETLLPLSSTGKFVFKEFPNLKETVVEHPLYRPFSPVSSVIDSFDFDWENNAFNSSVIQMYL